MRDSNEEAVTEEVRDAASLEASDDGAAVVLLGSTLGFWLAMTAADDGASRPLVDGAGGA